ncbi:hypothetical protein SAMN05216275_109114 [Streptosporangium canum]|uniref:Uncharacterized protein n=1 Tax=Streptosporangium canum TaxID=324952 RepID=A0A1I3RN04_9ACTN|nr:DUF6153 family protein [Streptosporangium canum]SFJ47944.1 hypothetical protein SAMN05216275_109114 [Streptosporangium canum]
MDCPARRHPLRVPRRLLLLITLVLGIAGMHTLGHADHGRDRPGAAGHGVAAEHGKILSDTTGRGMAAARRGPGPALVSPPAPESWDGRRVSDTDGDLPRLDPASVCLAVLTALLVLLLGALWARRRAPRAGTVALASSPPVARPPPRRTALRLARLSVLRI